MSPTTRRGLLLAALILLGWLATLALLLPLPMGQLPPALLVLAVLARTFLQTGLFIVGHDAMHRVLVPGSRRWNDGLGRLVLLLYAALPYGPCCQKHHQHHHRPGSAEDPDFHAPGRNSVLACYHFGYHREHHRAPQLAWHQLPQEYRQGHHPAALALATVPAVASKT